MPAELAESNNLAPLRTLTTNKKENKMTATTSAPAIKKISLGGIAKKTEKKGTDYPQLPDPSGDVAKLTSDIINESREMEALEGSLKIKKMELKALAQAHYFNHLHGKHDIPSSVEAVGNPDEKVLVTFQNRYATIQDEEGISTIIGAERTAQFFRQAFELKIDGDKIPAESAGALIDAIQTLFAEYNASEALTAKEVIKPTPDFHTARHTALSVEENLAVEMVCPIVAMVKTKGRK